MSEHDQTAEALKQLENMSEEEQREHIDKLLKANRESFKRLEIGNIEMDPSGAVCINWASPHEDGMIKKTAYGYGLPNLFKKVRKDIQVNHQGLLEKVRSFLEEEYARQQAEEAAKTEETE